VITASAKTKWLMVDPAAASFEGEFSSVTTSYAGPVTSVVGPKLPRLSAERRSAFKARADL
jgi:hypothetical protein